MKKLVLIVYIAILTLWSFTPARSDEDEFYSLLECANWARKVSGVKIDLISITDDVDVAAIAHTKKGKLTIYLNPRWPAYIQSRTEMEFVLLHECAHVANGDLSDDDDNEYTLLGKRWRKEFLADEQAVRWLIKQGRSPQHVITFLRRLGQQAVLPTSHPPSDYRIRRIEEIFLTN